MNFPISREVMSSFSIIQQKIEQFIKKFYTNELIKGAILFFAIGLFYFLLTLLIEYFLWLRPLARTILFWLFILVELSLFIRFIALPLLKLFRLQNGISHEEASKIIGNHFPQVSDKLLNVLQLNQNQRESELLLASIEQKASQLQPIPFKKAITFNSNLKYLKYAAIPVLLFIAIQLVSDKNIFSSSYNRVVNYNIAYEPPAPFSFFITNESLQAVENKSFTLKVTAAGDVLPENVTIDYNNETYFLRQTETGMFEYVFSQPSEAITFQLKSNKVISKPYTLNVIKTPALLSFEMQLDYPNYTGKKDETIKNTGNAIIPEGTKVRWNLTTKQTEKVTLQTTDSNYVFKNEAPKFSINKRIFSMLDYTISTSNTALKNYENLSFRINVIKDEFPEINVQSKQDTINDQITYFFGRVSDDYGLTKLQVVYYPSGEEDKKTTETLILNKGNFDQFTYSFPGILPLKEGVAYEYYFEVFDNDVLHNYKNSRSGVFSFRKLTKDELESKQLESQQESIQGLDDTLKKLKDQDKKLEELSKIQKEKKELSWNDKKKLENFIKRQKQQEELMKNFSKQLDENLENFQKEEKENDPFKEELQKRLKENEEALKKNEELLKELEKIRDKINKEELTEKLEKLAKNNKNQEKNLEQLLELTKRYYVAKKTEKIADELQRLGEKQEKLSEESDENNTKEKQEELNKKFEELMKELEELRKENEQLKEPMEIPQDKTGEKKVEEEQKEATEKLEQENKKGASENQKKAGQKMKEMGKQMQSQMSGSSMESIEEDIEMLRQILDNLVVFSFEQEDLMNNFKSIEYSNPVFGKKLKIQNELKQHFAHIDDSLFALALRQPSLGKDINEILTEVEFSIEKSLERLAENRISLGTSSQQYTITGANELAVLLSNILGNMQNQMQMGMGTGKGKGGQGFQLPDIIKKQEELTEEMKEGTEKGKKNGKGKEEGEGQGEGEGEGKGKGNGEGEGENGGSQNGNGEGEDGYSEEMNGELYRIYQEQQLLRQKLQEKLGKEGLIGTAGDILKQMEEVENELLEKGFNDGTLQKMTQLKYELLKLDEATFLQGEDQKREATTNRFDYDNPLSPTSLEIQKYFNNTEILNRKALPLRLEYKKKVQDYFKEKND